MSPAPRPSHSGYFDREYAELKFTTTLLSVWMNVEFGAEIQVMQMDQNSALFNPQL